MFDVVALGELLIDFTGNGVSNQGNNLDEKSIKEMLVFANAAASIITTRKGALRVMPTVKEVLNFLENNK